MRLLSHWAACFVLLQVGTPEGDHPPGRVGESSEVRHAGTALGNALFLDGVPALLGGLPVCQGLDACVVEGHLWPCAQASVALFAVDGEALDPPLVPPGVNAQGQAVAVPVLSWFGDLLHPPGGEGVSLDARHGFPPRNISTRSVLWGQENVKNVLKKKWPTIGHFVLLAERAGFEPARTLRALRAFQARLFVHSSTSPRGRTFHTGLALGWNVSSMANPLMACQRRHRIAALFATLGERLLLRCSARGRRSRTGTGRRRRLLFARAGVAAANFLGIRNCSWCVALQLQIQDF